MRIVSVSRVGCYDAGGLSAFGRNDDKDATCVRFPNMVCSNLSIREIPGHIEWIIL